jgi:dynein heavy chain
MEKTKIEMQKCFDIYKILEDFNYRFSKDELDKRWIIFGSPEEITQMVEKRVKDLDKDKVRFLEEMKLQQEGFKEDIDNLERTIHNFHSWQDIKAHENAAKSCMEINKSLAALQEDAKKFNSREGLFDIEGTDYNKIQTMVREFTPYSNLWITADQWFENSKSWLNGEW